MLTLVSRVAMDGDGQMGDKIRVNSRQATCPGNLQMADGFRARVAALERMVLVWSVRRRPSHMEEFEAVRCAVVSGAIAGTRAACCPGQPTELEAASTAC